MNVTREVVRDLLPVYLSGEASADTGALVEEWLARDPELAREAEAAGGGAWQLPASPPPPATAEKQTLDATRQLMKNRTATLVMAILFTLLPLVTVFEGGRVTFLLIRDKPVIGVAWWVTAAVMWIGHTWIRRRLKVSGL